MRLMRTMLFAAVLLTTVVQAQNSRYQLVISPSGSTTNNAVVVQAGQTITFTATAWEYTANGQRQQVPISHLVWAVGANMPGTITPQGVYTAPPANSIPLPAQSLVTATAQFQGLTMTAAQHIVIQGSNTTPPDYTVTGTVTDASNQPIAGAIVQVHNNGMLPFLVTGHTDRSGMYSIRIPAGTYVVLAQAPGFVPEWYDNQPTRQTATPIVTNPASKTITGIDFVLAAIAPPVLRSISGNVNDGTTGIDRAIVMAVPATNSGVTIRTMVVHTDANGDYTMQVPDGTYLVRAEAPGFVPTYHPAAATPQTATQVTVNAQNPAATSVDVEMFAGATISGTVTDAATNAPIAHARVMVLGPATTPNGGVVLSAMTDAQGAYHIGGLPAGSYKLSAEAQGYAKEFYDDVADVTLATAVVVGAGQTVSGIDFDLARFGGSIAGLVLDAANTGIGNAVVNVWSTPTSTNPSTHRFYASVRTAQDGSYLVLGVPAGSYVVQAHAPGFLPEFYDNAMTMQAATPVVLTLNQQVTGIDFELGAGGAISGTVYDDVTNAPIAHAFVMLHGPNVTARNAGVRTDAHGNYTIGGLPSGQYRVFAMAPNYVGEYYDDASTPQTATLVTVAAPATTTGIDFSLAVAPRRVVPLTGTVTDQTGAPLNQTIIEAVNRTTGESLYTTTDMQGMFSLTADANTVLRAHALGYVGAYSGSARDWKEAATNGFAGGESFRLRPMAEAGMATLSGIVRDADTQLPLANVWVYGHDASGDAWFAITDENGRYSLAGTSGNPLQLFVSGVTYDATEADADFESADATKDVAITRTGVTSVERPIVPDWMSLEQNWPNPFNPSTMLAFTLAEPMHVRLALYDAMGREVRVLAEGMHAAGRTVVRVDASTLPSGAYFYRLTSGAGTAARRMLLVR